MSSKNSQKNNFSRFLAIAGAILITLFVLALSPRIKEFQALGYFGGFLIMLLSNATVIFPVPGVIFVTALGATLNPWLVGLFAGPGAALGEFTGYLAGYGGVAPIDHTRIYKRFDKLMDKYGLWLIFVLAIIPNPLFDMAGILAGAAEIPKKKFFLTVLIGKTIQATLLAWAGALSLNWFTELVK